MLWKCVTVTRNNVLCLLFTKVCKCHTLYSFVVIVCKCVHITLYMFLWLSVLKVCSRNTSYGFYGWVLWKSVSVTIYLVLWLNCMEVCNCHTLYCCLWSFCLWKCVTATHSIFIVRLHESVQLSHFMLECYEMLNCEALFGWYG